MFISALLAMTLASAYVAFGGPYGLNRMYNGWGGYGINRGFGSFNGGYSGYGRGFGGYGRGYGGFGFLSGEELSDEELEELCCGDCCSDGCCYELCACAAPCGMGGFGGCGGMGMGRCSFPQWGFGNRQCGPFSQGCGYSQPSYGWNGFGQGCQGWSPMNFGYAPCQGPTGYGQGSNMAGGQVCGHNNQNCADVYGGGQNNCGYNQGNTCGSYNNAYMNADACKRSGNRGFSRKFDNEFLVRKSNEACESGNDCYDGARANMCADNARVAGQRSCGNANSCHSNAAGINCADRGVSANGGCFRTGAYGAGSPCGCAC